MNCEEYHKAVEKLCNSELPYLREPKGFNKALLRLQDKYKFNGDEYNAYLERLHNL